MHDVAIYHRGLDTNFHENCIADCDIGTFITFTQRITNTLYVGHSRGNADLSDKVTGHTIYDGANTLDGNHFAGFAASNAHTFRTNGSALRHTSHVMTNTPFENDGSNSNFPYLSSGSAHPGDGTDEGSGIEQHAIAAFTVSQSGEYSITNSALNNGNQFSDGVNVKVHVTGGPVRTLETIGTQGSGSFNTSLGFLNAGQTIYIGVGANEDKGGDASNPFDFSIQRTEPVTMSNGNGKAMAACRSILRAP